MIRHPLHQRASSLAARHRALEIEWIEVLQEIDSGKWFLRWGYPSLFKYCTSALQLTENVAYMLIGVARKCAAVRPLQKAIQNGELNPWRAKRILSVVNSENAEVWIERAKNLGQRELEQAVAAINPQEQIQDRIQPVSENLNRIVLGASNELVEILKRVGEVLAQESGASPTLAQKIQAMGEFFLEKRDPVRKADRLLALRQVTKTASSPATSTKKAKKAPEENQPHPPRRQPIPAHIRHQVMQRDRGACRFKLPDGTRCGTRQWIDIHHLRPVSTGGDNSLANLITLCRAHHASIHRQEASLEFIYLRGLRYGELIRN